MWDLPGSYNLESQLGNAKTSHWVRVPSIGSLSPAATPLKPPVTTQGHQFQERTFTYTFQSSLDNHRQSCPRSEPCRADKGLDHLGSQEGERWYMLKWGS